MNRKLFSLIVVMSMLFTLLPSGAVHAAEDTAVPVFHSVNISQSEATGGDTVKIEVDAKDIDSGLESVEVIYQYSRTQDAKFFELTYNETTQKYESYMEVNGRSFGLNGLWKIAYIMLTDKSGNKLQVFNQISSPMFHATEVQDLSHANLQIQGNDITPPIYHGLRVDKSEVVAGDQVKISLLATDQSSGVDYATVRYENRNSHAISDDILLQYNSKTGHFESTVKIENEFTGGRWIVNQLSIFDKNFNAVYLSNTETQENTRDAVNFHEADFTVIDQDAPVVSGVEDGGLYNEDVYPTFNEGTATLNNASFESGSAITEEGSYWLYVKDSVGNTTYVRFEIDKTAPIVYGVEQDSVVKEAKPVFEDGEGTLNGKPFASGTTILEEGNYTLVVTDRAGNETVIAFEIDRTGPTVSGVEDGRAYASDVVPKFEETATLNGKSFESGTVITEEAVYELIVTDGAGNQTKVKFMIDKTGPTIYSQVPGERLWEIGEYANTDFEIVFTEGTAVLNGKEIMSGHKITEEGFYTVVATDALGNQTVASFTMDKTSPKIEGVTFGYFNTDLAPTFNEGTATLNGKPYSSGTLIPEEGEYLLGVTDLTGNSTSIWFFIDKTAPKAPVVNEITEHTAIVKGEGQMEEAAIITVWVGDKFIGKTDQYVTGSYQISIPKQKAGTKLTIIATDAAGNASKTTEVFVKDVTPPAAPTVNEVYHYSSSVTGSAEIASTVTVKAGESVIGTGKADSKGNYKVKIPNQKISTKLTVTATDATGNVSGIKNVTVKDGNYTDLKSGYWAYDEIMYLADQKILTGYEDGSFKQEKLTTRAEAAKMLSIALDLPVPAAKSAYKDVRASHWAKDYIAAASKAGLFNGNPDGTFAPDKTLKRSEMAKIISIAYEFKASGQNHFKDVKSGYWATGYISGLYENGITTGYPDKTFRAEEPTTRAEFSVFLARALNKEFR